MEQLRIAALGDYLKYYSYFLYGVMEGSIRLGHLFRPIPLFHTPWELIWSQIEFFRPHILLCHCIFNRKPWPREKVFDLLKMVRKKFGTKVFYHMGDARTIPRYPHDISDIVDFGLVNNADIDTWEDYWDVPCIHWPYGALCQDKIAKRNDDYGAELTFTGGLDSNEHHADRKNLLEELQEKGIKVRSWPDSKLGNSRFMTNLVSASSKGVIGTQMGKQIPGYLDVRPFQYIGAGALYFHEAHPNIEKFFIPLKHYIPWESPEDLCEKFDYFTRKDYAAGVKIRMRGFEFAQRWHSTESRMAAVINLYNGYEVNEYLYIKDIKETIGDA